MIVDKNVDGNSVTGPSWAETYDGIAQRYDGLYSDEVSMAEDVLVYEDMAKRGIDLAPSILDLGCGTGLFLDGMETVHPIQYHGVDISGGMIKQAKLKHPQYHFQVDDMRSYADDLIAGHLQVGAVVSTFSSMSYIKLSEMAHILEGVVQKGGQFYVMLHGPEHRTIDTIYEASNRVGPDFPTYMEVEEVLLGILMDGTWNLGLRGLGRVGGQPQWTSPQDGVFLVATGVRI